TIDDDPAGITLLDMVDAPDQRRFSRARGTAKHDLLAGRDAEIDVIQCREMSEPLHEALHGDDGLTSAHLIHGDLLNHLHLPKQRFSCDSLAARSGDRI